MAIVDINTVVPIWIWIVTSTGIIFLFLLSFVVHTRNPHEPTMLEAGYWTIFFISLAIIFGIGLSVKWDWNHGLQFYAGYITEYSLSIDNLFVFALIMSSFSVPRAYQQKVLLIGIVIALLLRTIFIIIGGAAIAEFSWVFYLFGIFLIITCIKLIWPNSKEEDFKPNIFIRTAKNILPLTDKYDGARLSTKIDGHRYFTPMLLVMITIGFTDIMFALDSIPAIYGLTDVPYIVFATNAFALLGLVELYFLIGGLLKRLIYLNYGLALVLGFIGIKLILHAMKNNQLLFINEGQNIAWVPDISTSISLITIVTILAATTIVSLVKSHAK